VWPVLLSIGGRELHTWGALAALGFLVSAYIGLRRCRSAGIDVDRAADALLAGGLAAVVGGRGLYVLGNLSRFDHPLYWLDLRSGGASFFGGLLLAVPVASLVAVLRGVPLLRGWDAFAPGFAAGFAVSRIGCFAAGCCHGSPTDLPWAVTFPGLPVPVHPTQLLEAGVHFALAFFLLTRRFREGGAFVIWLGTTAVARFFLELLRGDPGREGWGFLTQPQGFAILVGLVALAIGLRIWGKPLDPAPPAAGAERPDV